MKNLIKAPGDEITWANSTGTAVSAGDLVIVKSGTDGMCGVAQVDIANGASGSVRVKNAITEHTAESGTGKTFGQGDVLYRDASDASLTKTASGNTRAGRAAEAKLATATLGELMLNQR